MDKQDIVYFKKGAYDYSIQLKNGDYYLVVPASNNARGHKCHKAYVQHGVDIDCIRNIIMPMLVISKLPEEEQIEYFN